MNAFLAKLGGLNRSDESEPRSDQDRQSDTEKSKHLVLRFIYAGVAILLVYAIGETGQIISTRGLVRFAGFMLLGGAGFACGSLTGFLFGIPRSLQSRGAQGPSPQNDPASSQPPGSAASPTVTESRGEISASTKEQSRPVAPYTSNTNLEEISDWLTKIIVGLGLINLKSIPGYLKSTAVYFATLCPAGCVPIQESAVLAILLYFAICGFFLAYLLTRLELPAAFSRADLRAALEMRSEVTSLTQITQDLRRLTASVTQESASNRARILTVQAAKWIIRSCASSFSTLSLFFARPCSTYATAKDRS